MRLQLRAQCIAAAGLTRLVAAGGPNVWCIGLRQTWQTGLGAVFISGVVFLLLTVTKVRQLIINAVPMDLKFAIVVGIGAFIAFIGMKSCGIVAASPATFVTLGNLGDPKTLLSVAGIFLIGALLSLRVPGAMLAQRLPTILPPLDFEESLEVTKIYSVSGKLPPDAGLMRIRPFRAPHHTISDVALVGGGGYPRPGEVSLAHRGVLFLDELPEFRKTALEALRQPLEGGVAAIARAAHSVSFPAACMARRILCWIFHEFLPLLKVNTASIIHSRKKNSPFLARRCVLQLEQACLIWAVDRARCCAPGRAITAFGVLA